MWKKYNKFASGGGVGQGNTVAPGRRSVCGEDGTDELQLESELTRLKHQMHVMEGDRRFYCVESCNRLRKQQSEIENLLSESEELDKILRLCKNEQSLAEDERDMEELGSLIDQLDSYHAKCRDEQRKIADLDAEILCVQQYMNEERKLMGCDKEEDLERNLVKRTKVTENMLDQEVKKFNRQLAKNAALREELDHLREDRAVFNTIYRRLTSQLSNTKKQINVNIRQASQAYEERDEAQTKMMALKERSNKDQVQQETEMKELQRIIRHDNRLKEFMGVKAYDRADFKEQENAKKQRGCADRDSDSDKHKIQMLQEAFDRIKEATGEEDITKIVADFIHKEDQNFALYNYVNELNDTVDNIQEEIDGLKAEIQRFEEEDVKSNENRRHMIRDMELQCETFSAEKDEAEKNNVQVCKVLDEIRVAVDRLFKDASCDSSAICDMLGSEEGVTNKNILKYMGIIEQRTMELIQLQQYIQMKKESPKPEKKDSKRQPTPPISQQCTRASSRVVQVAIVAPNTADEEDPCEDGELRPLTQNEIKAMVMRTMGMRDSPPKKASPVKRVQKAKSPSY